jgi:hypothetical protein
LLIFVGNDVDANFIVIQEVFARIGHHAFIVGVLRFLLKKLYCLTKNIELSEDGEAVGDFDGILLDDPLEVADLETIVGVISLFDELHDCDGV